MIERKSELMRRWSAVNHGHKCAQETAMTPKRQCVYECHCGNKMLSREFFTRREHLDCENHEIVNCVFRKSMKHSLYSTS